VRPDVAWVGRHYQPANRLASLYFLREIGKVDGFLANVYFTGDPQRIRGMTVKGSRDASAPYRSATMSPEQQKHGPEAPQSSSFQK